MKLKSLYRCQQCGFQAPKWAGQCPDCEAWNTLVEEVVSVGKEKSRPCARPRAAASSGVVRLSQARGKALERVPTGIGELDRILGGGVVCGQVLLLAGPPGIGKSTLMLQAAGRLAARKVLYVSGEESLSQVADRARRIGLGDCDLALASETELGRILEAVAEVKPGVIVLDSIQTVFRPELSGGPGTVGQVRDCAAELLREAKASGAALFLLGHVTKEGAVAGPKVLEHIVDTVLQFAAEERQQLRVLRAEKNRFGPTSEIGLFEMTEGGLREVLDPSALFLEEHSSRPAAGRAVSVTLEGSRPILVEVQALVTPTHTPLPRRMATGLDVNRLFVLVASLEKHLKLRFDAYDVYINIAGGLRVKDPALDLAVCLAVVSSARDTPLPAGRVFIGEVGLLGEIGRAGRLAQRLREAERLGFKRAVIGARAGAELAKSGAVTALKLSRAADIPGAVEAALRDFGE
ncbi:MAG: DNA repair protein RadA [Elusimicrobia bacterium]|nr:DNA repair protein RadA [Elusimicrobiota bacterium]